MSSILGRIGLLGTGAFAGTTLYDKTSLNQLLSALNSLAPA
eukprot:CAMPEP_0173382158 /NCGR_PEP_ID=MMETSP1356-20130122/4658_1 /TAXON_ID=77927 ORGANISM="Hemiselmis virescens, Strain PCC157" /NCGR_SAMPLE_ID=MMETSP1356 /ASSEMBLY_ACC=CAM_ASM_000847 /LENGTH=40 /DNA_ID= /DNA_START= /DNA_END= /DNA_ORIENTATION=